MTGDAPLRPALVPPTWWRAVGLALGGLAVAAAAQPLRATLDPGGEVSGQAGRSELSGRMLLGPAQAGAPVVPLEGYELRGPVVPCRGVSSARLLGPRGTAAVAFADRGLTMVETLLVGVAEPPALNTPEVVLDAAPCDGATLPDYAGERFRVVDVPGGWVRSGVDAAYSEAVQVRSDGDRAVLLWLWRADGLSVDDAAAADLADRAIAQARDREPRVGATPRVRALVAAPVLALVALLTGLAHVLRRRLEVAWLLRFAALALPALFGVGADWPLVLLWLPLLLALGVLARVRAAIAAVGPLEAAAEPFDDDHGARGDDGGRVEPDAAAAAILTAEAAVLQGLGFDREAGPGALPRRPGTSLAWQTWRHPERPVVALVVSHATGPERDVTFVTPIAGLAATVATSSANDLGAVLAGVEQTHPEAPTEELWRRHLDRMAELESAGLRWDGVSDVAGLLQRRRVVRAHAAQRAPLVASLRVLAWQLWGRRRATWQPARTPRWAVRRLLAAQRAASA